MTPSCVNMFGQIKFHFEGTNAKKLVNGGKKADILVNKRHFLRNEWSSVILATLRTKLKVLDTLWSLWQARNFPPSVQLEGSLSCSQEPEPDESSSPPHFLHFSEFHFNIILPAVPRRPTSFLRLRFCSVDCFSWV